MRQGQHSLSEDRRIKGHLFSRGESRFYESPVIVSTWQISDTMILKGTENTLPKSLLTDESAQPDSSNASKSNVHGVLILPLLANIIAAS